MLHIKLKGMEHRAPCKHIFCLYPWGGVKEVILHIKLKGMEHRALGDDDASTFSILTLGVGLKGQNSSHVA